jgi:hypothetical protein
MSVLIQTINVISRILDRSLLCAYQSFLMTFPGKHPGVAETTTTNDGGLYVDAAAARKWVNYLAS